MRTGTSLQCSYFPGQLSLKDLSLKRPLRIWVKKSFRGKNAGFFPPNPPIHKDLSIGFHGTSGAQVRCVLLMNF